MKKFLLTLFIIFFSNQLYAYDCEVSGIYYNLYDGYAEVTYGNTKYSGDIVIPDIIEYSNRQYPVTSIGYSAFSGSRSLTGITIPNSVSSIGYSVFEDCSSITEVNLEDGENNLNLSSGFGSSPLKKIYIGRNLSYSYNWNSPFANQKDLTYVEIGDQVTFLVDYLFYNCSSLSHITIPSSVTSIGNSAFKECTSLKEVTFNDGKTTIQLGYNSYSSEMGEGLFANCPLEKIHIGRNLSYDTWRSYGYSPFANQKNLISVTIGEQVTTLHDYLFYGCNSITGITIPSSVTSIGNYTFEDCISLKEVTFNDGKTTIQLGYIYYYPGPGKGLFADCPLEHLYIGRNLSYDSRQSYGDSPFANQKNLISVTIGEQVTTLPGCLLVGCSSLTSITIPNSVTSIGYSVFFGCSSLTSITIPNSVTSIGYFAFNGCNSLSHITIPNSVTSIDRGTFVDCTSLASITIPNSVTSIGESAFEGCSSITEVNLENGEETLYLNSNAAFYHSGLFSSCPLEKVYIGRNLSYSGSQIGYSPFSQQERLSDVTIGNKVTSLDNFLFYNCLNLSCITLPSSVTSIGNSVFEGCSSLTSIEIPHSVTAIGASAFYGCLGLQSIIIPGCVKEIGNYSFNECTSLKNIVISDADDPIKFGYNQYNHPGIGKGLFYDCPIENLYIGRDYDLGEDPYYYSNIGYTPFPGTISSLVIGEKVNSIPAYFLYFGNQCESLTIPDSIKSIGSYAFRNSTNLKSIKIPELVENISTSAFEGCEALSKLEFNAIKCETGRFPTSINEVLLGDKVTNIPEDMFRGSQITQVKFPDSLKSIGREAFRNTNLTSVFLPPGIESIGSLAFYDCRNLLKIVYPSTLNIGLQSGYSIEYPKDFCIDEYGVIYDNQITKVIYAPEDLSINYVLPASIIEIGETAFSNCKNIKTIIIGENISAIGNLAYYGCDNVEKLEFNAVSCNGGNFPASIKNVVIGDKVSVIPDRFLMNSEIEELYLSESVEIIGKEAFYGNKKISLLVIPKNIISIEKDAFYGCDNVEKLEFNAVSCNGGNFPASIKNVVIGDKVSVIPDRFLMNSEIEELYLSESVEIIGKEAFYGNKKISLLTIPQNVKIIQNEAFAGCDNLETLIFNAINCEISYDPGTYQSSRSPFPSGIINLQIGENVTTIPQYFTYDNNAIERIIIPNKVTTINDYAFAKCSNIKSFLLGSGVSKIEQYAFSGTKIIKFYQLSDIEFIRYLPEVDVNYTLSDYPSLSSYFIEDGFMYVPVSLSERTCDLLDLWNSNINDITINSTITHNNINFTVQDIGRYAFYKNNAIERISLNNNGEIEDYALSGCENLKDVYFNNKGKIGYSSCSNNENLSLVRFGEEITNIESFAFSECPNIIDIKLPDSLTDIGSNVFENCKSLQSAYIGKNLESLSSYLFNGCSSLQRLDIPSNINLFYDTSFKGCTSLTDVNFDAEYRDRKEKHRVEFPIQEFSYYNSSINYQNNILRENVFNVNKGDVLTIQYNFKYYTINTAESLTFVVDNKKVEEIMLDKSLTTSTKTAAGSFTVEFDSAKEVNFMVKVYAGGISANMTLRVYIDTERDMCFFYEETDNATFADCPLNNIYLNKNFSFILESLSRKSGKFISPFDQNLTLNTVTIGDNVDRIFESQFNGCSSLFSFNGGNNIDIINKNAFKGCKGLENISLYDNTQKLGEGAFIDCENLKVFSVGKRLQEIGSNAFNNCPELSEFYCYATEPPVCETNALSDINKWECTLYVPYGSLDPYRVADQWKDFFYIREMSPIDAEEIILNESKIELKVNDTFVLEATVLPDDTSDTSVTWNSSDERVASVSESGLVTALSDGTAIITASCGNVSATCEVTVLTPIIEAEQIVLNIERAEINIGETIQLEATVMPENTTDKSVTWNSSDERVASVSGSGLVTALSDGSAIITASCGNVSATCEVTVLTPIIEPEQIVLNIERAEINIGETIQLEATVIPENTTDKSVTWYSSDERVASVSESGLVTALSEGTVIIRAQCGDVWTSCTIIVLTPIIEPEQIFLNITEAFLNIGESVQLEATVIPEETTDPSVIWSSSNANIASVSEEGLVVAIRPGDATITATCGEISAECLITVLEDAGLESLLANPDSMISIYTTDGIMVKKDCMVKDLKTLVKGIYIIVSGKQRYKISI